MNRLCGDPLALPPTGGAEHAVLRRRVRVCGLVQGVGFRPFVYRLAQEIGLVGWVKNDGGGVEIEAQGSCADLDALLARLVGEAPPLARIDSIEAEGCLPDPMELEFSIALSQGGEISTAIGPDMAICPDCLRELFDPQDRRWRYPFLNCTHCGPRYTITRALPYDRVNTSMSAFALCEDCRSEYHDPNDRRYHAEPVACPACGPALQLLGAYGEPLGETAGVEDPIAAVLQRLLAGEIIALKGLGGFHLICDARNPEAVTRLRERKSRESKPFVLMLANLVSARQWAVLRPEDENLLLTPERPVVLVEKRAVVDHELWGVAPELGEVGVMLPYTPLHYLLFHEFAGRPSGTAWLWQACDLALVCTSANPGGEPLVIRNREAVRRLTGIADAFLVHNRDIVVRCDDSVARALPATRGEGASLQFMRRSRGYTPRSLPLANDGACVLAFGGWLKNTVCLMRGREAFLSQHVGELENAASCQALDEAADHLLRLFACQPRAVAHDLHPDYHSTHAALSLAARLGIPAISVQHHHAHIAAVLAECGHTGPALGLALDGSGLGADGSAWGGELLHLEGSECQRLGHLAPLPLAGGDRAAREPWRMASAVLHRLGRGAEIASRYSTEPAAWRLADLLSSGSSCRPTSSLGRVFDAAAALLGLSVHIEFEGQAAMLLEARARAHGPALPLPGGWTLSADGVLDLFPLLASLADETKADLGAARFHATLAAALEAWTLQAVERSAQSLSGELARPVHTIALGGGCMLNRVLATDLARRLSARGLCVLEARAAPPNDGGLSLGQAWVARQILGVS